MGKVGKSSCHTCHITYADEWHRARLEFESSEEFKRKLNTRHRKEEKNREMKTAHRLRRADSVGLFAMRLQTCFTAFVVNLKEILTVIPA